MLLRRVLFSTVILSTAILLGASGTMAAAPETYSGSVDHGRALGQDEDLDQVLRRWAEESMASARADANIMREVAEEEGYPFAPTRHRIQDELHFRSPEIVSVLRFERAYEGGTNGSIWLVPVNWDAGAEALIPIESVFDPIDGAAYARLSELLRDATIEQVWNGDPDGWEGAIEAAVQPAPETLSSFTFVRSTEPGRIGGIAWHFEPYIVAPGARGVVSVIVPQAELRPLMAPEWRPRFAGEPASLTVLSAAPEDRPRRSALAAR